MKKKLRDTKKRIRGEKRVSVPRFVAGSQESASRDRNEKFYRKIKRVKKSEKIEKSEKKLKVEH